MKILQYSNSWGHLVMSLALLGVAVFLFMQHDAQLSGVATSILLGVQTLWIAPAWQQKPTSTIEKNPPTGE